MTDTGTSRTSNDSLRASVPLALQGTAFQRGFDYGRMLKAKIHEAVRRWQGTLEHEYGRKPDAVIRRFLNCTDYLPAMERWTPDLVDEIRGLAEGCGLDFNTAYTFQLLDEMWNNAEAIIGEHCSSLGFAATDRHPTYLAQNLDVESFRDGHQTLLRIEPLDHDIASLIITSAGALGFAGLNDRGLGVCCNAMMQVPSNPRGLPVVCVLRGALQRKTAQEAAAFIREVSHACGQHYLVGDQKEVISLECSANKVVQFRPEGSRRVVWHTNHPLATDDLQPWYRRSLDSGDLHPFVINSNARLDSLRSQIQALPEPSVAGVRRILSSKESPEHPICGTGAEGELYTEFEMMTFASTIMELSDPPLLHVALGPPDRNDFVTVSF